ncbi:GNAT family N-acetyltransferase [Tenggerimyces flavus]|uniref:GNAT family N-acetyltransferase n=1 Tax=Tenggerimyces flavus TaxID=1708749 RepID=A0ABV7Y5L0_9ACTN|nr:GNAT family N-acetyltransferase [Tenggerimyces flavus]MBM7790591.1 GNAT superfamily N-acetyltransferase [Tenggerimyces flavus]
METPRIIVRPASLKDLAAVHALAERSVLTLLDEVYTAAQLEAGRTVGLYQVEEELFADGTYYVLEVDGLLVAGSGWSARGQFYPPGTPDGSAHSAHSAAVTTATMRATYVDPAWTRRGFASLLAQTTEAAARIAGFRRFEALCTPLSEAVRLRLGYHVAERVTVRVLDDISWPAALMRKTV